MIEGEEGVRKEQKEKPFPWKEKIHLKWKESSTTDAALEGCHRLFYWNLFFLALLEFLSSFLPCKLSMTIVILWKDIKLIVCEDSKLK